MLSEDEVSPLASAEERPPFARRVLVSVATGRAGDSADRARVGCATIGSTSISRTAVPAVRFRVGAGRAGRDATLMHVRDLHVHLGSDVGLEVRQIGHATTPAVGQCTGRQGEGCGTNAGDQELP